LIEYYVVWFSTTIFDISKTKKMKTTTTFVKDSQSRITRYGMKCLQIIDGMKCYAFAHATKKGGTLVISENYSSCIDNNGNSISGTYRIVTTGIGNVAPVVCEKL
jgi:hypothetical protein